MSETRRYQHYSVVQYVHARREERVNVGVAVFDSFEQRFVPAFDPEIAAARIRCLFPEEDTTGVQHYLASLVRSLPKDQRVLEALDQAKNPLEFLVASKQNMIQFSPVRLFGAASAIEAAQQLLRKFVSLPDTDAATRELSGVKRAREVTRDAIAAVMGQMDGLHYSSFEAVYGAERFSYRIRFPFYLPEKRAVIDAISLAGSGVKGPESEADHFIKKVSNLVQTTDEVEPYATAAVDPKDPHPGRELIRYIRHELQWKESRIVEAEPQAVVEMVRDINQRAAA